MSLDVYLQGPEREIECRCSCCDHLHTRKVRAEYYDANITHNLGEMADRAGIYRALWRPDENGFERAEQLIEPLEKGLALLQSDPDRFRAFNPENGWGSYEGLVRFTQNYLAACREYPTATIHVSR